MGITVNSPEEPGDRQPSDADLEAEPLSEPQQPEEQPALETQNEATEPPSDTDLAATPPSEPQSDPRLAGQAGTVK